MYTANLGVGVGGGSLTLKFQLKILTENFNIKLPTSAICCNLSSPLMCQMVELNFSPMGVGLGA